MDKKRIVKKIISLEAKQEKMRKFSAYSKITKNPIQLTEEDAKTIANYLGLSGFSSKSLLRLSKQDHNYLASNFSECLNEYKNENPEYVSDSLCFKGDSLTPVKLDSYKYDDYSLESNYDGEEIVK